uniref:MAGUK p55 subfamily member 2 n=1 Tax=Steinernema glaseri TaxID=37863 RepID=A0A1I7ZPN6_9BILA
MTSELSGVGLSSFTQTFEEVLENIIEDFSLHDVCKRSVRAISAKQSHIVASLPNRPHFGSKSLVDTAEKCKKLSDELANLVNKPHIQSLFSAYDDVVRCVYAPRLPEIPHEVDDDEGIAVKIVRLVKTAEPLGATIKCLPDGVVCIARVIAGGVADRSASIHVGDHVLEVNGVSVAGMSPTEIVDILSRDGDTVVFKLTPARVPIVTDESFQQHTHVRALKDYDGSADMMHPCPEAALSFHKGDILEILVSDEVHWYQARCLGNGSLANGEADSAHSPAGVGVFRVGLMPSELLQRKRHPKQDGASDSPWYEPVCRWNPRSNLLRPVVLIGAHGVGRSELRRCLLNSFPQKYCSTVPHTSRAPRPNEVDGVDYHFSTRAQMETWIREGRCLEYGEYRGNIYATLTDSVTEILDGGQVPLLSPHPFALQVLRTKQFMPIVIFVKPPELRIFRETRLTSRSVQVAAGKSVDPQKALDDDEICEVIRNSEQLERTYGHTFDAQVVNDTLDHCFSKLCRLLRRFETRPSWIPVKWMDECN